jgi:hypothetical protein
MRLSRLHFNVGRLVEFPEEMGSEKCYNLGLLHQPVTVTIHGKESCKTT